ncbi:MAG: putative Fe-S cluster assembly protein SufT [Verrucomicrobiota bacterium]|nr:putative Fe-S cluster assembly protein SufT [Verrucomicrobiota bacterium]
MHENEEITFTRDCEAIQIPSGVAVTLPAGTRGVVTQSLGGSYTVAIPMGLARINAENADALGFAQAEKVAAPLDGTLSEKAIWDQLKTCYDPEIPVNIVDLGLVYDCAITPAENTGAKVDVKMTLTAPGCGMGPTLAAEARQKILGLPGVTDAEVELVWDPPWNQGMISEAGKMQLGLI